MSETCVVSDAKVRDYLLNLNHPIGRSKAVFFMSQGFNPEDWAVLAEALIAHFNSCTRMPNGKDEFGHRLECTGPLTTSSGKSPLVVSAWILRPGQPLPEFLSAYPA